jgi:hypothetical protein
MYWISTSLISVYLLLSAYSYFFSKSTIEGVRELGFPDFFRIELAILKIIAVLVLLIPSVPIQLKEWAYAGIGLFLLTAIVAHIAHKDHFGITLINLLFLVILIWSNYSLLKLSGS